MGGLRSLATPARPLCLGGIPHRPPPEGALGNGMLPVFLQHLPPPVGACGERNYGLFSPGFGQGRDSDFASNRHKTLNFIEKNNRPVPELARSQLDLTVDQNALRSSLLAARDQTGPNRGIPGLLTGRSKARCWWPGSSPYRDA